MIDADENIFINPTLNMVDVIALFAMNGMLAQHDGSSDHIVNNSYEIAYEFIKCSKNPKKYMNTFYKKVYGDH